MAVTGKRLPWRSAPAAGDMVLVAAALLAAAVLSFGGTEIAGAERVVVDLEGVTRYDASIDSQTTVTIIGRLGPAVIRIEGGRARIETAPCRGQICVVRGWLHATGDVAVCIPNRVVVRLTGGAPRAFDGITR